MTTRIVPEELVEFDSPIAELFRALGGPWPFRPMLALTSGRHFIPTADVFVRDEDLVITLDLPGIEPHDVQVRFADGELIVTGERKADKEVKEAGYYRKEATYGFFERHLSIPKGIKETEIKAEYDRGVLEITMPRAAKLEALPKAKVIPVKHATKAVKA